MYRAFGQEKVANSSPQIVGIAVLDIVLDV